MNHAILVEDLTRSFGDFTAVDRVSFHVERGEIFGYLGANGAGKSTTIKMLIGLLSASAGRAQINGFDTATQLAHARQSIGYVSQRFSLYLDLSARHNLEFFAGAYGLSGKQARQRVQAALAWAELEDRANLPTQSLPGGIRQRLALASALLHEPSILFLDEPTAGVSPESRRAFWRIIRSLAHEGKTIFVTTHHLDEAEYCHRVGLMVDGRLVALDAPDALKRTFVPGQMFHIHAPDDPPAALLEPLRAVAGFVSAKIYGLAVHARFEQRTRLSQLTQALSRFRDVEVARGEASLEDVFLAVAANASTARGGS